MLLPGGLEPGESYPKLNPLICTMYHLELLLSCIGLPLRLFILNAQLLAH